METHNILVLDTYETLCNALREFTLDHFKAKFKRGYLKEINNRLATMRDVNHIVRGKFNSENDIKYDVDLRKWIKVMLSNELYDFNFGDHRYYVSFQLNYIWQAYNRWPAHTPKPTPDDVFDIIEASINILDTIDTPITKDAIKQIKDLKKRAEILPDSSISTIETIGIPQKTTLEALSDEPYDDIDSITESKFQTARIRFELFENNPFTIELNLGDIGVMQFVRGENTFLIGRSHINHLALSDPLISRRHLGVMLTQDDRVLIVDFDSTNGTIVDGKRLPPGKPYPWKVGTTVRIGTVTLDLKATADV